MTVLGAGKTRNTFEQVRRVFLIAQGIAMSQHRPTCANVRVLANRMVPSGPKSKGDRTRNGRVKCFSRKLCV
jgi:hypothetical protein